MNKIIKILVFCFYISCSILFMATNAIASANKTIILTIDDLPFVGSSYHEPGKLKRENERFSRIMEILLEKNVPAVGFVISNSIERGQWQLLEDFKKNGFVLGNHTHSHANLGQMTADAYLKDVAKADKKLSPLMNNKHKYFRYPYLYESAGTKHNMVTKGLSNMGYQVVPVTVDSKDFRFNASFLHIPWQHRSSALPNYRTRYLNYMWQQTLLAEKCDHKRGVPSNAPQILLIHANLINTLLLGDIIDFYRKHGYEFVSIDNLYLRDRNYYSAK